MAHSREEVRSILLCSKPEYLAVRRRDGGKRHLETVSNLSISGCLFIVINDSEVWIEVTVEATIRS